jgi:hypothetical protein
MYSKGCFVSRFFAFAILFLYLCSGVWSSVKPHPSTVVPQEVASIDVVLEVGQFIHIVDQSPIKVYQYGLDDPYRTYRGCRVFDVYANFTAMMSVSAEGVVPGSGKWRAEIGPEKYVGGWLDHHKVVAGLNVVKICVQGEDVDLSQLSPTPGQKIAEVRISLLPF